MDGPPCPSGHNAPRGHFRPLTDVQASTSGRVLPICEAMAISRPLLLALLGAALLAATFYAVQNARTTTQEAAAPEAATAPATADQAPVDTPATEAAPEAAAPEAQALETKAALDAIVVPGTPLESAKVDFSLKVEQGRARDRSGIDLTGSFERGEAGTLPKFSFLVEDRTPAKARNDESLEFALTPGKAYLGEGDGLYAVADRDFQTLTQAASAIQLAGPEAPVEELDATGFVKNASVVGVEPVDGVQATHVTGELATKALATRIVRLVRSEASESAANADLPAGTAKLANRAVLDSKVDVWVGPDRIMRRLTLSAQLKLPKQLLDAGEKPRAQLTMDLQLSDVNKPQEIAPADDVKSPAPAARVMGRNDADSAGGLLLMAGYLVAPGQSVATKTFTLLSLARQGRQGNVARKVRAAVDAHRKVVVLFRNPRGLDDQATARSMRALMGNVKAATFIDDVANVASYGALGISLGVSQAPSTVIIDRKGRARVIEGFVDAGTLRQAVADAR